jgi:hypothetical protein
MWVRVVGLLVMLLAGWLLWQHGWNWWNGYIILGIGFIMLLYVRKIVIDETDRHLETHTGFFPFVNKHIHPAHQLRSLKLSVNHKAAKDENVPLRGYPFVIFHSTAVWNSGRWARLMSGRKIKWIEKRTYAVASALGLNVEQTDSYKRYREKLIGKE